MSGAQAVPQGHTEHEEPNDRPSEWSVTAVQKPVLIQLSSFIESHGSWQRDPSREARKSCLPPNQGDG